MRAKSSPRSTKPPAGPSNATVKLDDRRWHVEQHRAVTKIVARYGADSAIFRPSLGALLDALETNPKQYPKKAGGLKGRRAAPVTFRDGIVWRAVFELDEQTRTVRILSLGPHDRAYEDAKNR